VEGSQREKDKRRIIKKIERIYERTEVIIRTNDGSFRKLPSFVLMITTEAV